MVEPELERIVKVLKGKTAELLAPHQRGHLITYNHYFTETVQKVRRERTKAEFTRAIQDFFSIISLNEPQEHHYGIINYHQLLDKLMACNEPDISRHTCSEALDCMQAYYEVCCSPFHTISRFS